jgi:hypothetical protein
VLPASGQVLITGGDANGMPGGHYNDAVNDVNVDDPGSNTLRRLADSMARGRWYPTVTTLPNWEVLVHGGRNDRAAQPRASLVPEVYSAANGWRRLSGPRRARSPAPVAGGTRAAGSHPMAGCSS